MKYFTTLLVSIIFMNCLYAQTTEVTLEDLSLETESYWNGSDQSGSFESNGITFLNWYNPEYFSWSGFSYSNITDNTTPGYMNQYSAIPGSGVDGSSVYAVHYHYMLDTAIVNINSSVSGMYVTNATYTYFSMKDGDAYAKKFGGTDGNDPDWLLLTITGIDNDGNSTGSVEYYLADYRFENNDQDYIVDSWEWVDLSSLGEVSKLAFSLASTDNGDWGMNTPSYFAIDNLILQSIIPVELTTFNATAGNQEVSLIWETASERNNAGFEVERSYDNETFEKILFIDGMGTTTEKTFYSCTDVPEEGKIFYRLKQIDFDGSFTYSKTVEVDVFRVAEFQLHQNYPNPFNPVTTISFRLPETSNVTLSVYAVDGSLVNEFTADVYDTGIHSVSFDGGNLGSGVYIYKLSATGLQTSKMYQEVKSMILMK